MTRLRFLALAAPLLLAGCATPGLQGATSATGGGQACIPGQFVTGFDASGRLLCADPPIPPVPSATTPPHAGFQCASGLVVVGFDAKGRPTCGGKEATEPRPGLTLLGVYGIRNGTTSGLWDLHLMVEGSASMDPTPASLLVVRYTSQGTARHYTFAPEEHADGGASRNTFSVQWVRGDGAWGEIGPGDLVAIRFNLVDHELQTRRDASVLLVPEQGGPVTADFRTPPTYSTDTVITLR